MLPLFISVQLSSFLFGCSPRSTGSSSTTSRSSMAAVFPRRHFSSSLITPSRSPALPAGVFVAHCSASQPSLRDVMHGSAPRDSRNATMSLRWYSYMEHSEQGCESGVRILRGGDAKGSKVQRTLTAAQVSSVPPDTRHSAFGSIPTVAWTKAARLKDRIS